MKWSPTGWSNRPLELIKNIINPQQRIVVFDSHIVEGTVICVQSQFMLLSLEYWQSRRSARESTSPYFSNLQKLRFASRSLHSHWVSCKTQESWARKAQAQAQWNVVCSKGEVIPWVLQIHLMYKPIICCISKGGSFPLLCPCTCQTTHNVKNFLRMTYVTVGLPKRKRSNSAIRARQSELVHTREGPNQKGEVVLSQIG